MIIKSIKITNKNDYKFVEFSDRLNHIYSEKNSCGKTSLLRLIVYGLGFDVPDMSRFKINDCKVELIVENKDQRYDLSRKGKNLVIESKNPTKTLIIPRDTCNALSTFTGIDNNALLSNILGSMYIDQDRGWSLLNRGRVIGSNTFYINQFLLSYTSEEHVLLHDKKLSMERELTRYKEILRLSDKQSSLMSDSKKDIDLSPIEDCQSIIDSLKSERKQLLNEKKRIDACIKENDSLLKYIDDLKLVAYINNEYIPISRDNLVPGLDNEEILNTRKRTITSSIRKLSISISEKEEQLNQMKSEIDVDEIIESYSATPVSKMDIDLNAVRASIDALEKAKKDLESKIKSTLDNDPNQTRLNEIIMENAEYLGVEKQLENETNYATIGRLKKYSGTDYKQLILCYRLAYSKLIEETTGLVLPIIIDSPRNEVDDDNITAMYKLISTHYSNHQVLIASIGELLGIEADRTIELKSKRNLLDSKIVNQKLDNF